MSYWKSISDAVTGLTANVKSDGTNNALVVLQEKAVKIIQDAEGDANNSSTANLTSSPPFVGTASSTLGVNAIQVTLKTDQNCLVYVEQSPDGLSWDISDEYEFFASIANFGITVQAVESYVRVRVVNVGSATTTYFRLQTVLCPIVEALPRSLDERGNLKVAIKGMIDDYGFETENTPMGEERSVTPVRLVGASFEGTTVDPNYWTATITNNGTVTQANAQLLLSTTTTSANGQAVVSSFRRARYVSGSSMVYRSVVQLSAPAANNTRRWGLGFGASMPTITDGAYFEYNGTTFNLVVMRGSSATTIANGSFNGVKGSTWEPSTNLFMYEIYWTNSFVMFVIGGDILHKFSASATTWSATMSFYIYMQTVNANSLQTNNTLSCRVASIRRLGPLLTQAISKYQVGTVVALVLKYGAGNIHGLILSGIVNNSIVTLYDNTTNSGTIIWSSGAMGAQTNPLALDLKGIPFFVGLTLSITGANSNVLVMYE